MAEAKRAGNRKTKGFSVGEKFDGDVLIETQREAVKDFKEAEVDSGLVSI